jgi:hypothetical protein
MDCTLGAIPKVEAVAKIEEHRITVREAESKQNTAFAPGSGPIVPRDDLACRRWRQMPPSAYGFKRRRTSGATLSDLGSPLHVTPQMPMHVAPR